ncbi:MAG TPA: amino acid racemase [Thermoplasmatales archaeon]|nr:amino acid racemase [Thermoplasmatales archaeon]
MKKVGILGGMGPVSTIYFYEQIIKTFQKRYGAIYHNDYPYIVILSIPIPDNVEELTQKDKMREELIKAAQILEKTGVDFIVMPCNTEHIFYEDIIEKISIPMLNIVDETLKEVEKEGYKRALLFSTSSTIKYKLYEKKRGIALIKPSQEEQEVVDRIIYNLLAGKTLKKDAKRLAEIIKKYDVESVIVGCTELSLLFDLIGEIKDKEIFDSTKILVKRTVKGIMVE